MRHNNLEWIRLFMATQVLIEHVGSHLEYKIPSAVSNFPGVPGFFFLSGFLIYASYVRSDGKEYFRNRFLRIFPGLLFVTIGGLIILLVGGGASLLSYPGVLSSWFLSQITLGQAYNPALFRDIGVGVINGSLWTVTVELIFYATVPVIVLLEKRFRALVLVLFALSLFIYLVGPDLLNQPIFRNKTLYDFLATLSPIPWGWMFCLGILCVKFFAKIERYFKIMGWAIIPVFIIITFGGDSPLTWSSGNRIGILYYAFYICLILFVAFGLPYKKLSFDFSYGVYIWHMPIINLFLILNIRNPALAGVLTFVVAAISWFLIEKPALKLKRYTMRPV